MRNVSWRISDASLKNGGGGMSEENFESGGDPCEVGLGGVILKGRFV